MTGPERLRLQLQEQWIRTLIREELVKLLEGMKETVAPLGYGHNSPRDVFTRAIEEAVQQIKEEGAK